MKQEFITYKQALAFKELGFDEPCFGYYSNSKEHLGEIWYEMPNKGQDYIPVGDVLAPLKSQFFKWVRDKKLTDASINRHGTHDGGYSYRWEIIHEYGVYEERHFKLGYKTYEEAEDACINELIEIIKNK